MGIALADPDLPLSFNPKFREFGIRYLDGGSSVQVIDYCPFCGVRLPESLREAWFDRLDRLGFEPDDPRLPKEMQSDAWWCIKGLAPDQPGPEEEDPPGV